MDNKLVRPVLGKDEVFELEQRADPSLAACWNDPLCLFGRRRRGSPTRTGEFCTVGGLDDNLNLVLTLGLVA